MDCEIRFVALPSPLSPTSPKDLKARMTGHSSGTFTLLRALLAKYALRLMSLWIRDTFRKEEFKSLYTLASQISRLISGFIKYLEKRS